MADIENSTALLKDALDELRKNSVLSAKTLERLSQAQKNNTKATEDQTKEAEESAKRLKDFKDGLKNIARDFSAAAQGARDNREDFRSLKPAVDAFGAAAKMGAGALGKGINALGEALSGIGAFLPGWGKLVAVVGGGLSLVGKATEKYGKDVVDFATVYAKFALDEVQRVVGAYKQLSDVGGVTGESFKGLRQDAEALGLSMDSFVKIIARNSEGLAAAGGTVTSGTRAVRDITEASKAFEDQFLRLGIGFEQQRDLTAKFLSFQRINTQINLRDTAALTTANKNYIELLDEISRLTGKSRDKIAAELEAASRELRYGASLQLAQQQGTQDRLLKAQNLMAKFGPAFEEGYKDLFGGPTTQKAIELQIATGGAAYELGQALRAGKITEYEYIKGIRDSIKAQRGNSTEAAMLEERTGKLGQAYESMMPGMRQIANLTDDQIAQMVAAKKEQTDAGKNKDKETNAIVDAQKNLRDFAVQLDKIVTQKLFPTLAKSVEMLTDVLVTGANKLADVLGVDKSKLSGIDTGASKSQSGGTFGGQSGTRAGGGKEPAPATAGTTKEKIKQLESGGRNIGTGLGGGTSSAFGLYQMTRTTFNSLAAKASPGSALYGKTFEQMRQDTALQDAAMDALMAANQEQLSKAGLSTKDAAIYMAHVLGAGAAKKILSAADTISIDDVVTPIAKANNPGLFKGVRTVGDIKSSFDRVTGGGGYQYGGIASGPRSGYMSMLHGTEAVIPLPGGRGVPVEMSGFNDRLNEQVGVMVQNNQLISDLVSLMRTSVDTQQRIYRATAG